MDTSKKGDAPPPPAAQSPQPAQLHGTEADEEDENVKQLSECSGHYLSLQECLNRTNRNWKSCQPEVLALKACHSRKKKSQRGRSES